MFLLRPQIWGIDYRTVCLSVDSDDGYGFYVCAFVLEAHVASSMAKRSISLAFDLRRGAFLERSFSLSFEEDADVLHTTGWHPQ